MSLTYHKAGETEAAGQMEATSQIATRRRSSAPFVLCTSCLKVAHVKRLLLVKYKSNNHAYIQALLTLSWHFVIVYNSPAPIMGYIINLHTSWMIISYSCILSFSIAILQINPLLACTHIVYKSLLHSDNANTSTAIIEKQLAITHPFCMWLQHLQYIPHSIYRGSKIVCNVPFLSHPPLDVEIPWTKRTPHKPAQLWTSTRVKGTQLFLAGQ